MSDRSQAASVDAFLLFICGGGVTSNVCVWRSYLWGTWSGALNPMLLYTMQTTVLANARRTSSHGLPCIPPGFFTTKWRVQCRPTPVEGCYRVIEGVKAESSNGRKSRGLAWPVVSRVGQFVVVEPMFLVKDLNAACSGHLAGSDL